jgi:hypothetical protein
MCFFGSGVVDVSIFVAMIGFSDSIWPMFLQYDDMCFFGNTHCFLQMGWNGRQWCFISLKLRILDKWLLRKWVGEYSSFVLMIESSDSIWLDMALQSNGSVPSGADHGFALGWNETEWIITS